MSLYSSIHLVLWFAEISVCLREVSLNSNVLPNKHRYEYKTQIQHNTDIMTHYFFIKNI